MLTCAEYSFHVFSNLGNQLSEDTSSKNADWGQVNGGITDSSVETSETSNNNEVECRYQSIFQGYESDREEIYMNSPQHLNNQEVMCSNANENGHNDEVEYELMGDKLKEDAGYVVVAGDESDGGEIYMNSIQDSSDQEEMYSNVPPENGHNDEVEYESMGDKPKGDAQYVVMTGDESDGGEIYMNSTQDLNDREEMYSNANENGHYGEDEYELMGDKLKEHADYVVMTGDESDGEKLYMNSPQDFSDQEEMYSNIPAENGIIHDNERPFNVYNSDIDQLGQPNFSSPSSQDNPSSYIWQEVPYQGDIDECCHANHSQLFSEQELKRQSCPCTKEPVYMNTKGLFLDDGKEGIKMRPQTWASGMAPSTSTSCKRGDPRVCQERIRMDNSDKREKPLGMVRPLVRLSSPKDGLPSATDEALKTHQREANDRRDTKHQTEQKPPKDRAAKRAATQPGIRPQPKPRLKIVSSTLKSDTEGKEDKEEDMGHDAPIYGNIAAIMQSAASAQDQHKSDANFEPDFAISEEPLYVNRDACSPDTSVMPFW